MILQRSDRSCDSIALQAAETVADPGRRPSGSARDRAGILFCGRRRPSFASARGLMLPATGQPGKNAGRHCEGELGTHPLDAPQHGLRHGSDRFGSTERLLDLLAALLREGVAGVPGGSTVNSRVPNFLRHMGRHAGLPQIVDEVRAVVALGHLDFFGFQRRTSVRPVDVSKGTTDWRAVTWFCVCRAAFRAGSVALCGLIRMSCRPSFMPGMG